MIKSVKKIVSIIAAASVLSSVTFTCLPTKEAEAATSVSVNESVNSKSVSSNYGLADNTKDGTILHAWCWSFNTIKDNMKDIAEAGYTSVQTSPANECLVGEGGGMDLMGNGKWYFHYQPTDWKIGNYQLGSRDDFKAMCAEADKYGIKIIVDVLPNHTTPTLDAVSSDMKNAAGGQDALYHANGFNPINQWNDRYECTTGQMGGLPDVNTENPGFQKYYLNYCNDLIACGADGFRYDTAKHIGLPSDPLDSKTQSNGWTNNFWPVATGKQSVDGVSLSNASNLFIYGEVLQDANVKEGEYANYISLTASNYGGKLRSAINSKDFSTGNISNYCHSVSASKLVTWVESHDTYCNDGESAGLSDWQIRMCWAIIAARKEGTPLFFSRPAGSNGSANRWGNNKIGEKGNDQFKDPEVAAVNKFRNAMVGQNENLINYGSSQVLGIERGNKGEVIINLGGDKGLSGQTTNLTDGTYYDAVTNNEFKVSGGKFTSGTALGGKVTVLYDHQVIKVADVSADKTTQSFEGDSLDVTLSAKNCNSSYYTINDGDKISYIDGTKLTLGKELKNGEKVTLKLYGTGDDSSDNEEYVYTKIVKTYEANTLYADKVSGWGDMYAYIYKESGSSVSKVAAWPGVKMTYNSDMGRYEYQLPAEYQSADTKVIFTDGSKQLPGASQPGQAVTVGKAMIFKGTEIVYKDPTKIVEPLNIRETTTDKVSPQNVGTAIKITAGEVTGGSEGYTYKIVVNGNVIKNFSSSNTATWTPSMAGAYTIEVTAKDSNGDEVTNKINYIINEVVIQKDLAITATKLSIKSPANVGDAIKISAAATGEGDVKYRFVVLDSNSKAVYVRSYSLKTNATWTPDQAGKYTIYIKAKDSTGKEVVKTISYEVKGIAGCTISSVNTNVVSPQAAGTSIKITANAESNSEISYKYWVYNFEGEWTLLRNYSTKNSVIWTPSEKGSYVIFVEVKDEKGNIDTKAVTYNIK